MSIVINNSKNVFLLQTVSNSYAFGIDDQGLVRHLYWGKRIETVEDFEMPVLTEVSTNDPVYEITPEEFPVYGSLRYKEHCLKVTFADGTREVVYEYVGYQIERTEAYEELILELKDKMNLEDAFELKLAHEQENAAAEMGDISDGRQEAVEALVALGYSSTDALRAVRKVTDVASDDVEGLLKAALKNF